MKKVLLLIILCAGFMILIGCNNDSGTNVTASNDDITWNTRYYGNAKLSDVAYEKGIYVAVGDSIVTSSDGIIWTIRNNPVQSNSYFYKIAYGNGIFVAVGGLNIITSSDGITWTKRAYNSNSDLYTITYGNGLFVAAGNGITVTSTDGITWTPHTSSSYSFHTIAYGNGTFVADEYSATSTDGIAWTIDSTRSFNYIVYCNGLFISSLGSFSIYSSTNGISWTLCSHTYLNGIAYGKGKYVGVSSGIISSTDLINWHRSDYVLFVSLSNIIYANNMFVAVGYNTIITGE